MFGAQLQTDSKRILDQWATLFVGLGIVIRLVRFALRYPLWHDEAFIAANFIGQSYQDLSGSLRYLQVSPILFLWIEKSIVDLFGFNEWSLRLFPLCCSIGGLILFQRLVKEIAHGWAYPFCVAFLAVAYSPIRHGNEVKSYAADLFVATAFVLIAVRWLNRTRSPRELLLLSVFIPVAFGLSLPAIFVAGGIGLALFAPAWKSGRLGNRVAIIAFGLTGLISFFINYRFHLSVVSFPELRDEYLVPYWAASFPPFENGLGATMLWFFRIHLGNLFAYPVGGESGLSLLTFVAVMVGVITLLKGRKHALVAVLLAPFLLNLMAAVIRRYPYGGEARIAQHLGPSICLLGGIGLTKVLEFLRTETRRTRFRRVALIGFVLVGICLLVESLIRPYHMASTARDRSFGRWFWSTARTDVPRFESKHDLGLDFEPNQWRTGISSSYLCNQMIYGKQSIGDPRPLQIIGDARGQFEIVVFQVDAYPAPFENPRFLDWLSKIEAQSTLTNVTCFRVNKGYQLPDWKVSRYWLLEFESIEQEQLKSDLTQIETIKRSQPSIGASSEQESGSMAAAAIRKLASRRGPGREK